MKVSYVESLASYGGPESCVHIRKGVGGALTGVHAGRVIEPRNPCPVARAAGYPGCLVSGDMPKATPWASIWRDAHGPRAVTDPVQARKHFDRQPGGPASFCATLGSAERRAHREARGRTTMSHRRRKLDCGVVPTRLPNKAAGSIPAAAEVVEERLRAKENAVAARMSRRSSRTYDVGTALDGYGRRKAVVVQSSLDCCITSTRSNACRRSTSRSGVMRLPGWTGQS